MINRALAKLFLWIWSAFAVPVWALPAFAVPVEVTSGEHDGFTRVVLNFRTPVEWEFGRTTDGYRFRPKNVAAEYDLDPIFDKIGKTRLAAVSANAATSELDIGFACACHAIPFEFRPGIIVIDLRDGAPPKGSSFEQALAAPQRDQNAAQNADQNIAAADAIDQVTTQAAPAYDWLNRFGDKADAETDKAQNAPKMPSLAPLPSSQPDMQPLRDQLLRQLSRGASEGVIDLALPKAGPIPAKAPLPAARVALDQLGGIDTKTARMPDKVLGDQGTICVDAGALAVLDWGGDGDTATLLAQGMTALVGEFDVPQSEAVTQAVRARIFLGFGAEARLLLQAFPNVAENAAILLSLSHVVDGTDDPTGAFQGQGNCATPAALWAALSDETITNTTALDENAVILAFSGLPEHLRRSLGPALIDQLLAIGDPATATAIRNMIFRASDASDADLALAEAKIDLAKGDPIAAEERLSTGNEGANTTAVKALITRIKARVAQGLAVDAETVASLAALQNEHRGTDLSRDIDVAMIQAMAASGNFAAAFQKLDTAPGEAATVWRALAILGMIRPC